MDILFFFYTALLYIIQLLTLALSRYSLNEYDMAIRILAHEYASRGLVPYLDFGQVWPPGPFMLSGILLPYTLPFRNILFSSLSFGMFIGIILLYGALLHKRKIRIWLPLGLFVLLETVFLDEIAWNEPFSRQLLVFVLFLSFLYQNRLKWWNALVIGGIVAMIVWFKWKILVGVLLVWWTVAIVYRFMKRTSHAWPFLIAATGGMGIGFLTLGFYLWSIGALAEGADFMVRIPFAVLPYRGMPIPWITSVFFHIPVAIYGTIICYGLVLYSISRRRRSHDLGVWLIASLPFGVLPYALIRAEETHVRNFPYMVAVASLFLIVYSGVPKKILTATAIACTVLVLFLRHPWNYLVPKWQLESQTITESINAELKDCTARARDAGVYNSLFVGRTHYKRFVINSASLYLINTDVPPATVFIDEMPGIQNSMYYGALITHQLSTAPKPMLAILEASEQIPEPNETRFMTTHYMIEDYLRQVPYHALGICRAHGKYFLVRRYL